MNKVVVEIINDIQKEFGLLKLEYNKGFQLDIASVHSHEELKILTNKGWITYRRTYLNPNLYMCDNNELLPSYKFKNNE